MECIHVDRTASRGIAIADVYRYQELDLTPDPTMISDACIKDEQEKYQQAKEAVLEELRDLAEKDEIFNAHLEIAGDYILQEEIDAKISVGKKNAQLAVHETISEFAAMFAAMDDAYMKEREADINDIGKRLIAKLKGKTLPDLGDVRRSAVVIARDLYPSDTVKLSPDYIKGIITEEGGITSHVSIIAKSMNIPILVGVKGILDKARDGETVCMDAEKGIIILNPDKTTLAEYEEKAEEYRQECVRLEGLRKQPAITKSGKRISLCANVGNVADIEKAMVMNIDGIGLFRSELLYMENNHFPTEEEQYQIYAQAARLCPNELTIRTLDIGGDKELSYFEFEKEENPFLGWRAIRISLELRQMFKDQLRAILRAGRHGNVRIMFPMIISIEEIREAKAILEECRSELSAEGVEYGENTQIGIMVETPASVLLAEEFADEVDFFSIGTNDLTQYLLCVDRGNKKIAELYSYFHPAVLKAIRHVIEAGHKKGIKVGMCGEMAGDRKAVSLLLEMGLDEFSMSAGSIDYIREQILNY